MKKMLKSGISIIFMFWVVLVTINSYTKYQTPAHLLNSMAASRKFVPVENFGLS